MRIAKPKPVTHIDTLYRRHTPAERAHYVALFNNDATVEPYTPSSAEVKAMRQFWYSLDDADRAQIIERYD